MSARRSKFRSATSCHGSTSASANRRSWSCTSSTCRRMPRERTPTPCWRCSRPIRKRHAFADVQLVLKVKQGDADGDEWLRPIRDRLPEACCLAKTMSALETRSLINCCDCFVSLHRSEGFGRGTGEAMFLGRLAMATGWSGNLDYMTPDNSLLVDHRLVPVGPADYPFGDGQMWAEADVDHAVGAVGRGDRRSGTGTRDRREGEARYPPGSWLPGRRSPDSRSGERNPRGSRG